MPERIRISKEGALEIVDPCLEDLPLLRELDPSFEIKISELPGFKQPRFLTARNSISDFRKIEIKKTPLNRLWKIHEDMSIQIGSFDAHHTIAKSRSSDWRSSNASFLDIKIEIAGRLLKNCRMCDHECRVDRTNNNSGICGLGNDAFVADGKVHIREEPPINPSFNISLQGCSMHCFFCQQHKLLSTNGGFTQLSKYHWSGLNYRPARSISFIGGNPDESVHAILKFLRKAPSDFQLPIVWNTNGYGSNEVYRLLNGVTDIYIPDLKFWSETCARKLSAAKNYREKVTTSILEMLKQDIPAIFRLLVMPGHNNCCHIPFLQWISQINRKTLWQLNLMKQYYPDFKIDKTHGQMNRRPYQDEIDEIRTACREMRIPFFEN